VAAPPLFVTGTDTGIGKTLVTSAIAAAFATRGLRVAVAKPAETGCRHEGNDLVPADALALAAAAGDRSPLAAICPHRFADPLAPALAAERSGATIDVGALVAHLGARAAAADVLLIEGAGGLLVPLTRAASFADLIAALGARVLVVVGSRLGAINHALLTLAMLAARDLPIAGYVVNHLAVDDLAVATNDALLRSLTPVPCLGTLPFLPGAAALVAALTAGGAAAADARARLAALGASLDLERLHPSHPSGAV
jgi:dethiobiotin synthetase